MRIAYAYGSLDKESVLDMATNIERTLLENIRVMNMLNLGNGGIST